VNYDKLENIGKLAIGDKRGKRNNQQNGGVKNAQGTVVNGRNKLSQKWSFKSEPVWRDPGDGGMLPDLIPG